MRGKGREGAFSNIVLREGFPCPDVMGKAR
jgi:hypothetical protein